MLKAMDGAYVLDAAATAAPRSPTGSRSTLSIPMIGMLKRKAEKVIIDTALKGLKKRVESLAERASVRDGIILFTGKGGVGKTTAAAGTAALAARARAAHAGALHRRGALARRRVRRRRSGRSRRRGRRAACACSRSTPSGGSSGPGARSRATCCRCSTRPGSTRSPPRSSPCIPGAEEVLALLELRTQVRSAATGTSSSSTARPTAETLRLLALPEALGWYMDRVFRVGAADRARRCGRCWPGRPGCRCRRTPSSTRSSGCTATSSEVQRSSPARTPACGSCSPPRRSWSPRPGAR